MSHPAGIPDAQLRIGDAERERTTEALAKAHSIGQLDLTEFDERCQQVMAAKTRGDLRATLADLPDTERVIVNPEHRRHDRSGHRKFGAIAAVITAVWLISTIVFGAMFADHGPHDGGFFFPVVPLMIVAFFVMRRRRWVRR
ncbi:MAG: DUF1707 domain-containing protein [Antricoccus sp.]